MAQALPVVDLKLSSKEIWTLSFWKTVFRSSAEGEVQLTFILTDTNTQALFDKWLTREIEAPQQIDHAQLVTSLWQKTRQKVAVDLAGVGGTALPREVALWKDAEKQMAEYSILNKPGRSFTAKQVTVLLELIDSIKERGKK